jgi:6-phosphogluconate dehydrogenase
MSEQARIGVAGLAVMGENLVMNMASKGFPVAVFNRTTSKTDAFLAGRAQGLPIQGSHQLKDFVASLQRPRRVMMMIRAGEVIDHFIDRLLELLEPGDIIIDGGNSNFQDTRRRLSRVEEHGLHYIGTGVSGGEEGALKGPSIMPGGSRDAWPHVEPVFMAIAARAGADEPCCGWLGPDGAGHFVKMVHNGIEYGDMQLICESYQIMKVLLGLDSEQIQPIFSAWNEGDLSSYLIEITADIFGYKDDDGNALVEAILDTAGQKGTGKWTVNAALDQGIPLSLISESVFARCLSALKDLRLQAAARLSGPSGSFSGDAEAMVESLGRALYGAKIISYTQGFSLLREASQEYGWNLDLGLIARLWRGGCIIRSAFLDHIAAAYAEQPDLENLLFGDYFTATINGAQGDLRRVVSTAAEGGIAIPCLASALAYFDGLRSGRLPANLLQAQRDYFGAHTYERIDQPRGTFFHTDWTGSGGDTTSNPYNT